MQSIGQLHRIEYDLGMDRSVSIVTAEAPGRIHFLGDQAELNTGIYLSAAIDRYVKIAVNMRKDKSFRFFAFDLGERKRSTLTNLKYRREDRWANYIKTAIFAFLSLDTPYKGMNFTVTGDIPQQISLASSTAVEVAAAVALRNLFHIQMNDTELAQKLKESHDKLFGSASSIADYQICLNAKKDNFLFVDVEAGEVKKIKPPLTRFRILLVDSHVPRSGVHNEINSRKSDALKGLEMLSHKKQATSFRDFASSDLLEALGDFPEQIRRRSIFMVEEIRRVFDACNALERKDLASFSKLIFHSQEGLRDLYEISCPEIDWLVKRAQELEGVAGSRMTGTGFGGCIYTIIRRELANEYKRRLEEYERIFGFHQSIYDIKLAAGAKVITEG
jgi:galactokinase